MEVESVLTRTLNAALAGDFKGIFAAVMFLSGLAGLGSLIYQLRIDTWPSTRGTLLRSRLKEAGAAPIRAERQYLTDVRYQYQVASKTYVGTEISPWKAMASYNLRAILQRQLAEFPEGRTVRVIYNPNRPQKAFLKGSGPISKLSTLAVALGLLAVPFYLF